MKRIVAPILSILFFVLPAHAQHLKVKNIQGEVSINGETVTVGQRLNHGAKVKTNDEGFIDFESKKGDVLRFKGGTMKYSEDKKENRFHVTSGKFFASVQPDEKIKNKKSLKKKKFRVTTKSAVMGIRGTKFYVEEKRDETYLCVCEGTVNIKRAMGRKSFDANAGDDVIAHQKDKMEAPKKASEDMWKMATDEFSSMGVPVD